MFLTDLTPFNLDALKFIAYRNVAKKIETYADLEQFMIKWWCNKYGAPDNDSRLLDKTIEDIIVEYFEEFFYNNPKELNAYKHGFASASEQEMSEAKKVMGDDFKEEIDYLEPPDKTSIDIISEILPDIEEEF